MSEGNGSALAVVETHPLAVAEYHRKATDVAGLVKAIVMGKSVQIGPRKYVPVDAYQAIANAMGCVASARDVRKVDGGYTAIGEVKRLSDGAVLAEGEGFVGDDEPKWKNGPEYARRSMVQTRAIGRACRAAFAFVVPMIDLDLSSTPAEEMEGLPKGSENPPAPVGAAGLKAAMRPSPPKPGVVDATLSTHDRELVMPFANEKREKLRELSEKNLKWFVGALEKSIDDAGKANFREANIKLHMAAKAELAHRGL